MNRRTVNTILKCFSALFIMVSIIMIVCIAVGDIPDSRKVSLLVQSGILLLCSSWLCAVIYKTTKHMD